MFSGIGGFELGIGKVYPKAKCVGFSEVEPNAIKVYKQHFTHKEFGDATRIVPEEIEDFDLLVGGFPCQAFSVAGKRGGFKDTRGTLFYEIARIVSIKRPKLLLMENVQGLLSNDNGRTFGTILSTFSKLGYVCEWQILYSKDFGVAQTRPRVFIFGHSGEEPTRAIFPIFRTDTKDKQKRSIRRYCMPTLLTSRENIPILDFVGDYRYDEGLRIRKDNMCPTLTARARKDESCGSIVVKIKGKKSRRLTPLECERLQGFPDNWTDKLSDSMRYKCIGNSVTVNVIEHICKKIKERYSL